MCLSGSAAHVQGCAQFYCSDGFLAEKQSGTDPEPLGLGWLLAGGSLPGAAGLAALVCATHSWDLPVLSTESLLHSSPRSPALQELWAGAAGTQLPRELPPSWGWGDPPEVPWAPQHPQEKLPGALAMHQQLNLPLLPVGQSSYRCCAAPGMGAPCCCAPCDGGAELGHRDWLSEAGERIN